MVGRLKVRSAQALPASVGPINCKERDVCRKFWASVTSEDAGVKERSRPGKHAWVILLLPEYAGRVKRSPRDGRL